jgi:hypothetical protein
MTFDLDQTAFAANKCSGSPCDKQKKDDKLACCSLTNGAQCDAPVGGAVADGFCGMNLVYDSAKSGNKCVLATCDGTDQDDVNACCKPAGGVKCSVGATTISGFCGTNLVYDLAKGDNKCRTSTCDGSKQDDLDACCSRKCSVGAISNGWCGPGLKYDTASAESTCKRTLCVRSADKSVCCKPTDGQLCSDGAAVAGWCGTGQFFDVTKTGNKCVGISCDKADQDDKNACCKQTAGQVCSAGATANGFCGANLVYDSTKTANRCVGATCDGTNADDTNACCKPTAGQLCSTGATADGFCGENRIYDETKGTNKCVLSDACDSADMDDRNACCKDTSGQLCSACATADGFCKENRVYDVTKATNKCVGVTCDNTDLDDINACCKKTDGQLCSVGGISEGFC